MSHIYATLARGTNYENAEVYFHIAYYQAKVSSDNEIFTKILVI
jgi:hypothetical protein